MITQMTDDADIKMMKDDADDDIDVDDSYWLTITIRGIWSSRLRCEKLPTAENKKKVEKGGIFKILARTPE